MSKPADGTGEAMTLAVAADKARLLNPQWSADGQYLVYQRVGTDGNHDIVYRMIQADGSTSDAIPFADSPATERIPSLSPLDRFLAYVSDESGRDEIYIRPFPEGAGRWQASVDGGTQPVWNRTGSELFYVDGDALMAIPVSAGSTLTLGHPQELFRSQDLRSPYAAETYDVSADGQRFLTVTPAEDAPEVPPSVRIVQNWYEEFRDRER